MGHSPSIGKSAERAREAIYPRILPQRHCSPDDFRVIFPHNNTASEHQLEDSSKPTAQDIACAAIFIATIAAMLYAPSIARLFQ